MWLASVALADPGFSGSVEPETPRWGVGAGVGPWLVLDTPNRRVEADFDAATSVRAGFAVRPPLWLSAEANLGLAQGGLRWAPRIQAEVLNPGRVLRPGLAAGLSLQGGSSTDPEVTSLTRLVPHWGPSLSVATGGPWFRVDLRHSLDTADPQNPSHHVIGTLGLEWLEVRRAPEIVAEVPPPAPVVGPPAAFTVTPAMDLWLSHPICAWVGADEAPALIARASGPITVVADGYLPIVVDPANPRDIVLQKAPTGGALVVAASPGDHLFVDGAATPVTGEGIAVVNTPKELVTVAIEGGGRRVETELAPSDGWAVWYRAPALPMIEVRFPQGSAEPGPDAVEVAKTLVRLAGDRAYRLQGSWSPEGRADTNRALAQERADRVRRLLIDAGMPPARVVVMPVAQLDASDPAGARVVLVSSFSPETP